MPVLRSRLVTEMLNMVGVPYIWAAKGEQMFTPAFLLWARSQVASPMPTKKQASPGGFALDCSGAVLQAFLRAGRTAAKEELWALNTDALWTKLPPTDSPLSGDLAFYGGSGDDVSHVEMVVGWADSSRLVVGASGGDSRTLTLEDAARTGGRVRVKSSHQYRADFRGFRSVVPFLG